MYKNKKKELKEKFEQRSRTAEEKGYTYLGRAVDLDTSLGLEFCDYGVYKVNKCGHLKVVCHKNFAKLKTDFCSQCTDESYIKYVESLGFKFKHFTRPSKNGTKYVCIELPCGHTKEVQISNLKVGSFRCQECLLQSYKDIAESYGMTYVRQVRNTYHEVILPCGCTCSKHLTNLKIGHWSCEKHKMSSLDSIGYVYMYKIVYDSRSWIKIGYSSNYTQRAFYYSDLPLQTELLSVVEFESGRLAVKAEKKLHKKLKDHKLKDFDVREYMYSGFSECYPIDMLNRLQAELDKVRGVYNG